MSRRDIIVIGASAGGSEALEKLCSYLPADLPAAIFVVWHIGRESLGYLPKMINRSSRLKAKNAVDGEEIKEGNIYVAPPDHHLMLEESRIRITNGPKENRFRPAIDPLFRSAAYSHNSKVIGIILSGLLNDGVAGLWVVKDNGGIALVQDPAEAQYSSMPDEAIKNVSIDHVAPVKKLAELIINYTDKEISKKVKSPSQKLQLEVELASGHKFGINKMSKLGELSGYTCPECHGSLWKIEEGNMKRFRCHTGHAYTSSYLLQHLEETIEDYLWNMLRGITEGITLTNELNNGNEEKRKVIIDKIHSAVSKLQDLKQQLAIDEKETDLVQN